MCSNPSSQFYGTHVGSIAMPRGDSVILTTKRINAKRTPEKGYITLYDAKVPQFCLRVRASGTRTWFLKYTINGRPDMLTIGRYPAIPLAEARKLAGDAYLLVQKGIDPKPEQQKSKWKSSNTFESFIPAYLESKKGAKTIYEMERIIRKYTKSICNKPLPSITEEDILDLRDRVFTDNGPRQSSIVIVRVRDMFNWAKKKRLVGSSPANNIERLDKDVVRTHVLQPADLKKVWRAAEWMGYPWGYATQMLIVTPRRKGQVSAMRHSGYDPDAATWHLTAAETKNGRPHTLPLPKLVTDIINTLPILSDDYVFVGSTNQPLNAWNKPKKELEQLSGVRGFRLHDLRRTIANTLRQELEYSEEIVGALLNHTPRSVTGRHYAPNVSMRLMREAMDAWAKWLAKHVIP